MSWGVLGLHVEIGGKPALADVDLEIGLGQIAAVVGGDGAGKTTLARVLGRLVRPKAGRLRLPPRRSVGYQPASSGSWPDLTVVENLKFVADSHRMPTAQARSRLDELIAATGLDGATDRLAANLSGGMRQKLGVAMALVARPEMLVLDEPTTGVDPVSRSELWRLVSQQAAEGTAIVMTTTYLDEAARAGSILALESGRAVAKGGLEEIRRGVPGEIYRSMEKPDAAERWRRGPEWRVWSETGERPADASYLEPDLTDLLTAATFAAGGGR